MIILPHSIQYRFYNAFNGCQPFYMKTPVILLLLLSMLSCQKEKKPDGILTHQQMVKVLSEIYVTEDKVQRMSLGPDSSEKVFNLMKHKIHEKTGVPDSIFRKSLEYYTDRPKEMESIYGALVDSLSLKEQRASFGKEAE